ncbi:hypothetical protein COOONC_28555 [Cooperia oncophora]
MLLDPLNTPRTGRTLRGVYSNGRLRCSLHGGCFNVITGNVEEYPALDNLYAYDVKDYDGNLVINTTEYQLAQTRRTRKSLIKELSNEDPIVVVGAGISAATFVEQARVNGCVTPITMITQEYLPQYDPKEPNKMPFIQDIALRDDDYYKENQIKILREIHVRAQLPHIAIIGKM